MLIVKVCVTFFYDWAHGVGSVLLSVIYSSRVPLFLECFRAFSTFQQRNFGYSTNAIRRSILNNISIESISMSIVKKPITFVDGSQKSFIVRFAHICIRTFERVRWFQGDSGCFFKHSKCTENYSQYRERNFSTLLRLFFIRIFFTMAATVALDFDH